MLKTDRDVYRVLDSMLPPNISREVPLMFVDAGEAECGVSNLLCEAWEMGCLTDEIKAFIRFEYEYGDPIDTLDGLEELDRQKKNSAA
ncbi:hypothetical protein [Corynebacterium anserum]|uniref:Uncharacterized protein n=1 Tax=Corynebacterium anserum TaxID=2684406 RepID=A0A7G7YMI8_9CORY|nr:hypothetical protein [Corynebacterium anserum]MBC2681077.1 hypothetical protein [Corynebacterium anserum]QNH95708.1 hypothetical protein GP473_02580 [Corynebacterium anserum]